MTPWIIASTIEKFPTQVVNSKVDQKTDVLLTSAKNLC